MKDKELINFTLVALMPLLLLVAWVAPWGSVMGYAGSYNMYLRTATGGWFSTALFFLIVAFMASLLVVKEMLNPMLDPPISTYLPPALTVSVLLAVIFAAVGIADHDFSFAWGFAIAVVALVLSIIYLIMPTFEGKSILNR